MTVVKPSPDPTGGTVPEETAPNQLVVFTASYPYGTGEDFLDAELPYLAKAFARVLVVPLSGAGSPRRRRVPGNVEVATPIGDGVHGFRLVAKGLLNLSPFWFGPREFVRSRVLFRYGSYRRWAWAFLLARYCRAHPVVRKVLTDSPALLYYYWGIMQAWMVPLVKGHCQLVRMHGYDIYEQRAENLGYIPFRVPQLDACDAVLCVSEHGQRHLASAYPQAIAKTHVYRLGTEDNGLTPPAIPGEVPHVFSCSSVIDIKRVELIARALGACGVPLKWTHFGDGPSMADVRAICRELPDRVETNLSGQVPHDRVFEFLRLNHIDLFVNMSTTEGLPVSVMEAMSFGIPVVATAAGGTPELVDDSVGGLLPVDVTAVAAGRVIARLLADPQQAAAAGVRARTRWSERVSARTNTADLVAFMLTCWQQSGSLRGGRGNRSLREQRTWSSPHTDRTETP